MTIVSEAIETIRGFPAMARATHSKIVESNLLEVPIREDAWTCRQVFHHLADSHMNSYIRIKLALTEHNPTITPYNEPSWAELDDNNISPEVSLSILAGIHERLSVILENLDSHHLNMTFNHPEAGILTIEQYILSVANHGTSHLSSVEKLLQ